MSQPLIPRYPEQARAMRRALAKLRDYAGTHEHGLTGPDEIAAYLSNVVGLTPMSRAIVNTYVRTRGLPVIRRTPRDPMRTTNLLLLSWCWSYAIYRKEKQQCRPRRSLPPSFSAPPTV